MIAFRTADLQVSGGKVLAGGPGTVVVAAPGTAGARPAAGTMMTFCHPVVTCPAVIRDGEVLAGGWLPDFARLGELERHLGENVIEDLVDAAIAAGRMPAPRRRRIMSYPFTIRMIVAMTLMPDAGYTEVIRRLAGHLADVAWAAEWHVPTPKVAANWRYKVPPSVMEEMFWTLAGPLDGGSDSDAGSDSGGPVVVLAGMAVCGIDGMLVAVADTPRNRAMFGCSGTRDQDGPGSAPFPQIQAVIVTMRAGRATLGAITGRARAGEQTLLCRLIRRRPELFAGRVFCFDRNFPGHKIITAILDAGGHVIARIKSNIALPVTAGGWLADGSRMYWLNAPGGEPGDRLPVRVIEHNAVLPCGDGEQVSQTCTLATTLLDHEQAQAEQIHGAYLTRWPSSETTFGEDKTTITGAGDRTSGEVSFTTTRHAAIRSMTQTRVTAATSLAELAALADATSRATLHTLITTGRQRHSPREQKARPRFPHTPATKNTTTGAPEITLFQPRSP
jgi:hypothetical protein